MSHRIVSKPYVLDRLFEIAEVLHEAQEAMYKRGKFSPAEADSILDTVFNCVDDAAFMLQAVLENEWWGGRPVHDRSEDPLNVKENNDDDADGA